MAASPLFRAGELTPTIEGRVDLPLYQNGAKKIINWMILPSGGLTRRPGTEFIWGKAPVPKTRVTGIPLSEIKIEEKDDSSDTSVSDTSVSDTSVSDTSSSDTDGIDTDEAEPMPTAQDLVSRLYRLKSKLEGKESVFDYGILEKEDKVYFDPKNSVRDTRVIDINVTDTNDNN